MDNQHSWLKIFINKYERTEEERGEPMIYLNHFISLIISLIYSHGYFGTFISSGLEYTLCPAPPSEVLIPLIGAMSAKGDFNIVLAYITVVVAGVLGSTIAFYIGYFLGRPIIDFIERKMSKSKKALHKVEMLFTKYSYYSVCLARITPFTRANISLLAGIEKLNIFKFWRFTALGIGIWDLILILLGYFLGGNISFVEFYLKKYIYIIMPIVFIAVVLFIIYKIYQKKKKSLSVILKDHEVC